MFWIHGGGWSMGSAEMYDGSILSLFGDVVVVTISYRLGIPDFSLETGVCSINWKL